MLIGQCLQDITLSHGLVISLFMAGLVGGFTHCAGMCSPFVLAQIGDQKQVKKLKSALLLPYHLGRLTTYVMLAVLVNTIVNLAFVFSDLKALIAIPLLMLAATLFLVSAFPGFSVLFPWAAKMQIAAPYGFIMKFSSKLIDNPGIVKRYVLGVLLGFMPCGLVVSALLASGAAAHAGQAALAMSAFAIGTMPALILVGFGGNIIKQKYPKAAHRLSQGAMVMSSLWLFGLAGLMLF